MQETPPPFENPRLRLVPYLPLLAIGVQIAWIVLLFLGLIFSVGDTPFTNTPAKDRLFDLLASWPSVLGLIIGVVTALTRWPAKNVPGICLALGTLICALFMAGFVRGLLE
jgi:hypothetical protein